MFVVCGGEVLDRLPELFGTAKAGASQGLSGEDAEPDLHLVEPTGRGRGEVEDDIGVRGQPSVIFLMGTIVVEDDVDLPVGRLIFNDLGYESLEVNAFLALRGLTTDDSGSDFQGGEEVDRAMPLVGAFQAPNDPAAARLNITGGPFQSLNRRLFVDAKDQRMFRRVQVQADNIGRFGGKLRVGADEPRAMRAQLNAVVAKSAPDRIIGDAEGRGQRTANPKRPTLAAAAIPVAAGCAGAARLRIWASCPAAPDRAARRCR